MGLAVLKQGLDSFNAVPLPQMTFALSGPTSQDAGDAVAEFRDALRVYSAQIRVWKVRMTERWAGLRGFVESSLVEGEPLATQFIVDEFLPDVIAAVSELTARLRMQLEPDPKRLGQIEFVSAASPQLGKLMRNVFRQYQERVADQHDFLVELYYQALALRAEHDPDARGGPTFTNAADLGRYLRENVRA